MGKRQDKESYDYYKVSYRANAKYYSEKHVGIEIPRMLSEREWMRAKRDEGITNKELVWSEFHYYTREQTDMLYNALKGRGFKISKFKISQKQITPEMWEAIKEQYHVYRQNGMTSEESRGRVSMEFFGSM